MNYLETNLKILKERFPQLVEMLQKPHSYKGKKYELLTAKNGQLTLKAELDGNSIYMHSAYEPQKEAQKTLEDKNFSDNDIIFVFGLGLGYQLQEIVRKAADKKVDIFVIERDINIFSLAVNNSDLTKILEFPSIQFCINLTEHELHAYIMSHLSIDLAKDIFLFDHPPSIRLYQEYYDNLLQKVRDTISTKLSNIATVLVFKGAWLKNNLQNLTVACDSPGINNLRGKFKDLPAIIVSAGPSLDKNVKELRKAKGKAVIIAVGTSLRTLLKEKILPDLVITYDASERNYQHFRGLSYDNIPLFFEPIVYPQILTEHHGLKFAFNSRQTQLNNTITELENKGYLHSGGSIATSAYSLAMELGCNPIIFVGQDLAFSEGRSHTKESVFCENNVKTDDDPLNYFEIPGYFGKPVLTARNLYTFLNWFETNIEQATDRLIINATEGGAMIKGTEQLSLAEAINKYCKQNVDVDKELTGISRQFQRNDVKAVKKILSNMADSLRRLSRDGKTASELCDELERMYRQRIYVRNKVKKIMKKMDALDVNIKSNESSGLLTEMLQDVLLKSERGELVKEEDKDDDFIRAEKRSASLRIYYTRVHQASDEVIGWIKEAESALDELNFKDKGDDNCANL